MDNEEQLTILVTGFGPFRTHKVNASWEAVKLLPELIKNCEKSYNVNLIIQEIPVSYKDVTHKVKELWEKHKPSIIVHVGVSNVADCLKIESQANSKSYNEPDIFNECPKEDNIDNVTLKTDYNVEEICKAINKNLHKIGCKADASNNAGRYLCEYIYYQSLKIKDPQVLFVHVPDLNTYSSEKIAQGLLEILIYLIECAIEKEVQ